LITALMAGSAPAGPTVADSSVEQIIAREFATWPKELGGAAVAVRITGRTLFFNEGMADRTSDHFGFAVQSRFAWQGFRRNAVGTRRSTGRAQSR
jgi:hypothetical protein